MPIYDYVCASCGHRFEVLRGLNEAGPSQCPLCEGPVSRAFAPPTIVFKGSGWAKLDRRSTGAPTRRTSGGATSGETGAGGGSAGGQKDGTSPGSEKRGESSGGEKGGDAPASSSPGSGE